jgi:hypothetical protein
MLYPMVVTMVAACFAGILYSQYVQRRKVYQLVWAISLTMGALAGLFFVLFLQYHRNITFFRLYYVFGALLMAAYLGLGSIFLLAPRPVARLVALPVVLVSVVGLALVLTVPVNRVGLLASNVEAGSNLISGPAIIFIALLNAFGAVAVIGGAMYSAWRVWRHSGPPNIFIANVLIAAGTLAASVAGSLARVTGSGSAFWGLLALGFVVLFAGFLLTSLPASRRT